MSTDNTTLVCFDLGGVIMRICRDWTEGCAAAGLDVREPDRFARSHLKARRRDLARAYQCGEVTCELFFAGIAESTDGLYTAEEIQRVHDAWILEEYAGVLELVQSLNGLASVQTACLSNTNHSHWQSMLGGSSRSPALHEMHTKIASQVIGLVKPDEGAYRAVEQATGFEPGSIVFFDDTEENIDAARSFGWAAHQIDPGADPAAQMRTALHQGGVLSAR